ncbi:Ig-like domain-containing protein, partial [uncultured Psychrobacter sp.]|uniref:Ig-like domain-containing protein n=1 Tax=uncultured Psychrobacter sp. TaxID=259303 RepID=UPI00262AC420
TGAYEVVLETPLTNGEVINATATDDVDNTSVESEPATAPDSTAPEAPDVTINADGSLVTVMGEEGATVSLTTPNGLIEGLIENGSFTAPLDPALTNGETISATLTDAANNTSDAGTARATDSTAPEAPVITDFDGTIVTGTAEPGSRVTILDESNTIIGSAAANTDTGAYEVVLETPLTNGEVINATATDDADNTSVESEPATAPDTTAPKAPVVDINTDGSSVTVMGEEGATVSITTPNGLIEGLIENGSFTAPLDPALTNGETISATLTDAANNTSDAGTARATDSTAPSAPTNLVVNDDGSRVSGLGEPDATVEIKDPTGAVIGTGTVAKDGTFDVVLTTPQRDGENLEVSLTDTAGNPSDSSTATAPDTTAPEAPVITDFDGTIVTGTAEPGSRVTIL